MSRIDEELTDQFYRWELRGRGWQTYDYPVPAEPPFRPFFGHFLPSQTVADDGRRHTFLSRFVERFSGSVAKAAKLACSENESEPEPELREAEDVTESTLALPLSRSASLAQAESFIRHTCRAGEPLALEIVATEHGIVPQLAATHGVLGRAERAVKTAYPGVVGTHVDGALHRAWQNAGDAFAIAELGLGKEFMLPLATARTEILTEIVDALDGLGQGEVGIYQVLFEPVRWQWSESVRAAVTDGNDEPFFVNRPELVRAAERKTAAPLFGVVVRLAAAAREMERAWEVVADMAVVLSALADPAGNHLVPLDNATYSRSAHETDLLNRLSRRSGMVLNLEELSQLVSLPISSPSPRLLRHAAKTKLAPELTLQGQTVLLGENTHAGATAEVRLGSEQRVRHTHVVGASGTGKSTLLFNLIRQDIENGEGIAVLDPHGDLIDRVLGIIPEKRLDDVIVVDPSDEEYAVGFNILTAHSDLEKTLLASDLVSVFERLSTSWGDQMNSVLRNAILAFLDSSKGGTLSDLRRFLLDPAYRKEFLKSVLDPEVTYYWEKGFSHLSGNRSVGPVLTRLDAFLSPKSIRRIVSQKANKLNFAEIMDSGKILLVKLSQGEIGRENAYLLGSLVVAKIQQLAMSRQRQPETARRDFWLYLDEFHHFITPSMAEILSGARKYRVGLTLAHQELRQLERDSEVASAVLSNTHTRIAFRVGDADARALERGFSFFEAKDLQNLGTGEAICRIERSDFDFNLRVSQLTEPDAGTAEKTRQQAIRMSREKYAIPRAETQASSVADEKTPEAEIGTPSPATKLLLADDTEASLPKEVAPDIAITARPVPESHSEAAVDDAALISPPPDLGRGGAQHQAIQQRLKSIAEGLGYRAMVEKSVLNGQGSVDLVLEKAGWTLACEISVTTTIDHEIGNIRKCLKAEFLHIAVVCPKATRLEQIKQAAHGCLAPEKVARLSFFSPEDFLAYIEEHAHDAAVQPGATPPPPEERRRGYKIKRSYVELSPEEMKSREEAAIKSIAETMRRKRGCKDGQ